MPPPKVESSHRLTLLGVTLSFVLDFGRRIPAVEGLLNFDSLDCKVEFRKSWSFFEEESFVAYNKNYK